MIIRENLSIGQLLDSNEDAISLIADMQASNRNPVLNVSIDATHSGRLTNGRVYPGVNMKKSVNTFLKPYAKPVLKHHDMHSDPIGRIADAKFIQTATGPAFTDDYKNPQRGKSSGYIQLSVDIQDEDAIQKFLDGRFSEVSTSQGISELRCSVCGEDVSRDFGFFSMHEHHPGQVYSIKEGKKTRDYLCYYITGDLAYREVSVVTIPADDEVKVNGFSFKESSDSEEFTFACYDGAAKVGKLYLSNGASSVDLREGVTAKDRAKLTDKTIVAVSPLFNMEDKNKDKAEETQETENQESDNSKETSTTDSQVASQGDSESTENEKPDGQKEDVVVPDSKEGKADEGGLSEGALSASIEALTARVNSLKDEKEAAEGQVERLKAELAQKDEAIEKAKTEATDSQSEVKKSYARQVMVGRMILRKADVTSINSKEAYDAKMDEFVKRSIDSLKDSLTDMELELNSALKNLGVKQSTDFLKMPKDSGVPNVKPQRSESSKKTKRVDPLQKAFEL